jgi:hypothetical protein
MAELISECISKNSFSRFGYKVLIRNETSHTQFTKSELISIRELKDNGLIIELPINICQKGHALTIFFLDLDSATKASLPATGHYKAANMEAMAKVEQVELHSSDKQRVLVDMNFTQNNVQQWKKIIEQYADRQEEINKMIRAQYQARAHK